MYYRTGCCSSHESIKLSKENDDLSRLIQVYIKQIFKDGTVSYENQKKLLEHYYNELSKAVDAGYKPNIQTYNTALAYSLKHNIAQFSAFKQASFKKQLEDALTKDDKILPWKEFKALADELHIAYNRRWLKTEYHHTVATANMAGQWQDFQENKDIYPNLKYLAVLDQRVRASHKSWDGLVLPINHSFWKEHFPPNDWGCRCSVEQTDQPVSSYVPKNNSKSGFNNNAGQSGKIFNEIPYEKILSIQEKLQASKRGNKIFANSIL